MKRPNLLAIAAIIVILGVLLGAAALKQNEKYAFTLTAQEMHEKITSEKHIIFPKDLHKDIQGGNDKYVLVDLRTPEMFISGHLPDAVNIPYERILDEDLESFFEDQRTKVLYDNRDIMANTAWMILTQYGYEQLIVLEGGLEGWQVTVENKDVLKSDYPKDEEARFDYSKIVKGVEK